MEGQELLTDVHGTHVHEADPWVVHDSGVQPRKEGCQGPRRPVTLRTRGGQQRWVGVGGFHGGGLALKKSFGRTREARDAWWRGTR